MPAEVDVSMHGEPPKGAIVDRIIMDEAGQAMRQGMALVQAEAQRRVPVRTGNLRRSLHANARRIGTTTVVGSVGTNVFYGPYLDRGTGLYGPRHHWIEPVKAKALAFPAGGGASFFSGGRSVRGAVAPGFTLAGRVRSGAAGRSASFVVVRRVRGVRPRYFMEDAQAITRGAVRRVFEQHAAQAAKRIQAEIVMSNFRRLTGGV